MAKRERGFLLPNWPRLMAEPVAAAYLSLGTTTLREKGPAPVHFGRRVLYDRKALDRWADALTDQLLTPEEHAAECREEERRFFERWERKGRSRDAK